MKASTQFLSACSLLALLAACQPSSTAGGDDNPSQSPDVADERIQTDQRAQFTGSLFTGVEQYENFNRLAEIFPSHTIKRSSEPYRFPHGEMIQLPETYLFDGSRYSVQEFLDQTRTSALLVIKNGMVRYEDYWLTGGVDVNWMSMSVGKSFVSALIGIAIDEGLIAGVEAPITQYVPELVGSAYDGVRIKDILQMSSGARWNEDYSDPDSDIMRYAQVWASGASFDEFTATLVRERPPGTYNYYNSTDTQALGMLLARATGKSLSAYAEEKLWQPLGMQDEAYWITDDFGMEMAAGGLQVTARDYAKLGQLYLQQGVWQGRQVIPRSWIDASLTADGPHLEAAAHPEFPVGYGYQWWLPESSEGEFAAIGVYNQFIWVNPEQNLVIVKLSANPRYGLTNDQSSYRELESFEFFRAIDSALR